MRKGQTKGDKGLVKHIQTRISAARYNELTILLPKTKGETVSSLIRKIIEEKPVVLYTRDESLDLVMEELAANRAEIRSIGININQMVKLFNTYGDQATKIFFARQGYERFLALENNIDLLLERTGQLAKIWLSD